MNSFHPFIVLDGASPLLVINTLGIILIVALSLPTIAEKGNGLFRQQSYQSPSHIYEDEDGVATPESSKCNPDRVPVAIHASCLLVNALLSLARATIPHASDHANSIEAWLQFAVAILLVLRGGGILCASAASTTRFRLGLQTGASCSVAAATLVPEIYFQYRRGHLTTIHIALLGTQLATTTVAGCCALLLRRRPDVFHNGTVVDRQHTVSFLGWLSFSWATPLLHISKQNGNLDAHDLPELDHKVRAKSLFASFAKAGGQLAPRLWWTILRAHAWPLVAQVILSLTSSLMAFVPRLALFGILQTLDTVSVDPRHNLHLWLYVVVLGSSSIVSNALTTWKFWMAANVISTRVYAQLTINIYDKSMRLSSADGHNGSDDGHTDSEKANQTIINMVASDAKAIAGFVGDSYQLLETPVKLIGCCILLWRLLGWQSVLAGLLLVLLSGLAHVHMVKRFVSSTKSLLGCRDSRMSIMTELIHGVRQVKFLAAEDGWEARINRSRNLEVAAASQTISCNVLMSSMYLAEPILLAVVTLLAYSLTHPSPLASTAFTAITVLSLVEQALDTIPIIQMRLVSVILFVRRIEEYLKRPEKVPYIVPSNQIELENATIVWPGSCPPSGIKTETGLSNLNLKFPRGELSVISGKTGSGKSLLLSCLIGECELLAGTVRAPTGSMAHPLRESGPKWLMDDAIAYIGQTAVIETGTIRDNILFGCPYLPQRYDEVLFACALYPDFELLSDGDMAEVGSNGVNLSGGQKFRISLARTLYSRAQTLIMDDIFSAVDVHTAKHLCEFALTGPLAAGRTRILATYQVELCLSQAEYLVSLDGQGSYQAAAVTESQRVESLCFERQGRSEEMTCGVDDNISERISTAGDQSISTRLTENACPFLGYSEIDNGGDAASSRQLPLGKDGQVGSVQWTLRDLSNITGGVSQWVLLLALFIIYGALTLGRGYAIRMWTSQGGSVQAAGRSIDLYLIIYIIISGVAIAVGASRNYFTLFSSLRGSAAIFRRLLHNVLRARLRWLDTIPVGNLVSRFSVDFMVADLQIGNSLKQFLFLAISVVTAIASGAIETPRLIVFAAALLTFCFWCARDYIAAARQLKRLESSTLGPIFDHLSFSSTEICTIRAFGRVDSYVEGFLAKVDLYSRSFWHLWLLNRWMGFWMNVGGAVFSTLTAVSILSIPHVNAAAAGLAISFTMQLGDQLINTVQAYAAFEMDMNSVHRLLEYANIELEDDKGTEPPAAWPTQGRLRVSDLSARYSPELPPVLRGLSFEVGAGQRIGVVGRTGAGKSSLSLALMRFLEVEGEVQIDGVDVSRVPLRRLRESVSLIPQSPILFSGTVRSNLDPLDQYDDADVISALESVRWPCCNSVASNVAESTVVGSERQSQADTEINPSSASSSILADGEPIAPIDKMSPAILQRPILEGGVNLSQGERQLLCLARAILTRPKILMLDESTSSVDKMTDEVIQQSIRSEFQRSSTLIVIAHRLRTIVDFDQILVLDQGQVAEFGTPSQLMKREWGVFRSLVEEDSERSVLEEIIRLNCTDQ